MSFNEMLEKYKSNTANEEEKSTVAQEIEKVRLINEYLDEETQLDFAESVTLSENDESEIKRIQKSLKKRNAKLVTLAVTITILFAILWRFAVVPLINEMFFYNPNPMNLTSTLTAYSQLHNPTNSVHEVRVSNVGIGSCDIYIEGCHIFGPPYKDYIEMNYGKLSDHRFALWGAADVSAFSYWWNGDNGDYEKTKNKLEKMPDYLSVSAYISFENLLTMQELVDLIKQYDDLDFVWTGIAARTSNMIPVESFPERKGVRIEEGKTRVLVPLIGFDLHHYSGTRYSKVDDAYPYFYMDSDANTADTYEKHFKALLNYQLDHTDALNTFPFGTDYSIYYQYVLDYINENGIKTYGAYATGSPEGVLKLYTDGVAGNIVIDEVGFNTW